MGLLFYALATARATNIDLLLFWGTKGLRFHRAGEIDVAFLKAPHYGLMHSDYPPLVPTLFAFASILAGTFSWWGPLLLTGGCMVATVAVFRGFARASIGEERGALFAFLMAAILSFGYVRASVGGIAEPLLILFAVTAVSALTFGNDDRGSYVIAAIALTGAVLTKIEGAGLVAIVTVSFTIALRRLRPAILLALLPAAALALWMLFVRWNGLLDTYATAGAPMHLELLAEVIRRTVGEAAFGAYYLPWFAAAAPLVVCRQWRRAPLPLLVTAGSIAAIIFYYMHTTEVGRIPESAHRVLLLPLACLVVAAAAACPAKPYARVAV